MYITDGISMRFRDLMEGSTGYLKEITAGAGVKLRSVCDTLFTTSEEFRGTVAEKTTGRITKPKKPAQGRSADEIIVREEMTVAPVSSDTAMVAEQRRASREDVQRSVVQRMMRKDVPTVQAPEEAMEVAPEEPVMEMAEVEMTEIVTETEIAEPTEIYEVEMTEITEEVQAEETVEEMVEIAEVHTETEVVAETYVEAEPVTEVAVEADGAWSYDFLPPAADTERRPSRLTQEADVEEIAMDVPLAPVEKVVDVTVYVDNSDATVEETVEFVAEVPMEAPMEMHAINVMIDEASFEAEIATEVPMEAPVEMHSINVMIDETSFEAELHVEVPMEMHTINVMIDEASFEAEIATEIPMEAPVEEEMSFGIPSFFSESEETTEEVVAEVPMEVFTEAPMEAPVEMHTINVMVDEASFEAELHVEVPMEMHVEPEFTISEDAAFSAASMFDMMNVDETVTEVAVEAEMDIDIAALFAIEETVAEVEIAPVEINVTIDEESFIQELVSEESEEVAEATVEVPMEAFLQAFEAARIVEEIVAEASVEVPMEAPVEMHAINVMIDEASFAQEIVAEEVIEAAVEVPMEMEAAFDMSAFSESEETVEEMVAEAPMEAMDATVEPLLLEAPACVELLAPVADEVTMSDVLPMEAIMMFDSEDAPMEAPAGYVHEMISAMAEEPIQAAPATGGISFSFVSAGSAADHGICFTFGSEMTIEEEVVAAEESDMLAMDNTFSGIVCSDGIGSE